MGRTLKDYLGPMRVPFLALPQLALWTLLVACVSLLIPVVIGFYFLRVWGWGIVPWTWRVSCRPWERTC